MYRNTLYYFGWYYRSKLMRELKIQNFCYLWVKSFPRPAARFFVNETQILPKIIDALLIILQEVRCRVYTLDLARLWPRYAHHNWTIGLEIIWLLFFTTARANTCDVRSRAWARKSPRPYDRRAVHAVPVRTTMHSCSGHGTTVKSKLSFHPS